MREGRASPEAPSLPFFASLYVFVFGAFGAEVPFLPAYLVDKGLAATQVGIVLAAGTIAQFSFAPVVGIAADRFGTRGIFAGAAAASAAGIALYMPARDFRAFLFVAVVVAMATAALTPLADALAVPALIGRQGAYGRIRGFGSAGFIAGSLLSGFLIPSFGIASILPIAAVLFVAAIGPVFFLPRAPRATREIVRGGVVNLLRKPTYRRVLCVSALVIGSHAMVDAFAVIGWRAHDIPATTIAVLLALAVGSELLVFVSVGPGLLQRYGVSACACVGAMAGCGRWAVLAESRALGLIALSQMLHGLTFALVHLACMRVLGDVVPRKLSATAQSLYGTISSGLASAAITLVAGGLYASFGEHSFWLASLLCLAALPFAARLSERGRDDQFRA